MSSKRCLSLSPSPEETHTNTTVRQPKNSPKSSFCLICGDNARIINYGARSCQSCKTFFRRNGLRTESVRPCMSNKCCEINMQTRHNCTSCRLTKCSAMGMSSDFIRKIVNKKSKILSSIKSEDTEQVTSQQIIIPSQLPTLDLTRDDRSLLLKSEWTLISNILGAYETYSNVSQMCHTIEHLSTFSVELQLNIINPRQIISQMFASMQSFISSLPDFRILTINEQTSLVERNLHGIIGLYCTLFFRNTNILHNEKFMAAFTTIYGAETMLSAKNLNSQLDPDSTLIKLLLIVFTFSSNCFIITKHGKIKHDSLLYGTFRLLGSQNVYLELLWKYMIYRYGYDESAGRIGRLMQIFLCVSKTLAIVYTNNEAHQNMMDTAIEHTKQSLIIKENEQSLLWGKT